MSVSRRHFLRLSGVAGIGMTTGGSTLRTDSGSEGRAPIDIRGALYLPSRDFNFYQMWSNYTPEIIERDLSYATRLNLNAIRTWVSYEFWFENREAHQKAIDHFLTTASRKNLKVLFSLFENVGENPSYETLTDTNPQTATPVRSPSLEIIQQQDRWETPRQFVQWFMNHYRNDDRLLAIEVMNEPGWREDVKRFAKNMFQTLSHYRGSIPLTVGSTSLINNIDYIDWGSDIMQFHYNYPSSKETFNDLLNDYHEIASEVEQPIWLSEWQKVASFGWNNSSKKVEEWDPNYASLAPLIRNFRVGNFFWSLMVQPAYTHSIRRKGVLNGVFHEDGAVWDREDAREIKAMSGNPSFFGSERKKWPEWARSIKHPER